MEPNDLKSYLDSQSIDQPTKKAVWDSYYGAKDPNDFISKFNGVNTPNEIKRNLYDAKWNNKPLASGVPVPSQTPGWFSKENLGSGLSELGHSIMTGIKHPIDTFGSTAKDIISHPMETLIGGGSLPVVPTSVTSENQQRMQTAAEQGNKAAQAGVAAQKLSEEPVINISGTKAFQKVLNPTSKNVASRAATGAVKTIEGLTSPVNLETLLLMGVAPGGLSKLTTAGFTGQMAPQAVQQAGEAIQAARKGEAGAAAEAGTQALLTGAMAGAGALDVLL